MEEKIGGRGDGVTFFLAGLAGADFFERVELGGARSGGAEEAGPSFGAEGCDARQATFDAAEVDGAEDAVEIGEHVADGGVAGVIGLYGCDEEDRGAGERGENGLRNG
jgi:hypothetical protein